MILQAQEKKGQTSGAGAAVEAAGSGAWEAG